MGRGTSVAALAALLGVSAIALGTGLIMPAAAQFGSIFGDPPPRPPSNVPGEQPRSSAPGGRNSIPSTPQNNNPPQGSYPPANYPPPQSSYPSGPGGAPGGAPVQSRPLPPPPGQAAVDPAQPGRPATQPARPRPAQPADTSPQPGDEVIAEPPSQKIVNSAALFSGLDKITGRIINFDVAIGETVQFGALQLTPRACYTRPTTETANTDAFIEVDEVTLQGEVRRIFTGWVFAASPGLHAVEHPIYDLWLTDCKGGAVAEKQADPPAAATPAATTPAARPPARPPQPKQQPPRQPPAQQQGGFPPFR
jgi:hypothetical protein